MLRIEDPDFGIVAYLDGDEIYAASRSNDPSFLGTCTIVDVNIEELELVETSPDGIRYYKRKKLGFVERTRAFVKKHQWRLLVLGMFCLVFWNIGWKERAVSTDVPSRHGPILKKYYAWEFWGIRLKPHRSEVTPPTSRHKAILEEMMSNEQKELMRSMGPGKMHPRINGETIRELDIMPDSIKESWQEGFERGSSKADYPSTK